MGIDNTMCEIRRIRKFLPQLPALLAMEEDCNSNPGEIIKRIDKLYPDEPLHTTLVNWTNWLYSSDQHIRDWNINYGIGLEITPETRQKCPGASTQTLLFAEQVLMSKKQREELARYRSVYPHR